MTSTTDATTGPPLIDFDEVTVSPDASFLDEHENEPTVEFTEGPYDNPDPSFIADKKRPRKAVEYERKIAGIFNGLFRTALASPATVPDAAAIAMHAKPISEAYGDLAAADPRIERAIDFVTSGTENPFLTAMAATVPLVLQLVRNHEPMLEPKMRGIKIPFGKRKGERMTLKFGVKLRGIPRNFTNDPNKLADYVFNNPEILAALKKQGLNVVSTAPRG